MFTTDKIHPGAFSRIGDRYSKFIDPHHFLGRNALDDTWITSDKPRANIIEQKNEYKIEIAIPGFSKNEITVDVKDRRLTIVGKKKDLGNNYPEAIRKEYGYDQISRCFVLPNNAKTDDIHSSYRNGILTIIVPFEKSEVKTVKVGS